MVVASVYNAAMQMRFADYAKERHMFTLTKIPVNERVYLYEFCALPLY